MSIPTVPHDGYTLTGESAELARQIRERTTRGMLLFNAGAVHRLEAELYAVAASAGGFWSVDYSREWCDCPDYEHRAGKVGAPCKHLAAVGIARAARRSGVREVRVVEVASGDPFRACGSRRMAELRDVIRHDADDAERERAREELARLRRG
jgi:uncharacterized Zn finger protein